MSNIIELAKGVVCVIVNSEMGIGHPYKGLFISRILADKIQRKFGLTQHEYVGVPDKRGIERYYLTGDDKNVEEAIAYALHYGAYDYNQSKLEIFKPVFTKGYFVIDVNNIDLTQCNDKNPHHLAIKTLMNYVNVIQPKP